MKATEDLIFQLLAKKAIQPCEPEMGQFVSRIFLRHKSNGSYRLILDLSDFNAHIAVSHFKMDTLAKTLTLVTPFCYFCSLDLADAYLIVGMDPHYYKFLRFIWKGQLMEFVCMPFGLKESPFRFTKLAKAPLSVIRQAGFTISAYLDDFLNCEFDYDTCNEAICYTYNVLVSLGFLPNNKKSVFVPCQIIESLGHILNSVTMTVYLPPSKSEAITALCEHTIGKPRMSIRFLCTVIGKLVSCFTAHPLGRLHYRSMERLKVQELKRHCGDFEAIISLDQHSISDLRWWVQTLPTAAAPISRGVPTCVFTCDASKRGWSACFDGVKANGHFSTIEAPFSTNTKEILAVLYGLRSHVTNFRNRHVLALSDSTTAISIIKSMGSMDNLAHDCIAQDLWNFASQNNIWVSMSHIPGILNEESDEGSRILSSSTEWALPQKTFDKLLHRFRQYGPVIMDVFASRLNYKLKPYVSFGADPYSSHVDCFTMPWNSPYVYFANPPFSVISKTVQKIRQDNATVMMIFPFWPTQMWLNPLLNLLISEIVVLPKDPPLFLPWEPDTPHPLADRLALCTAMLCGDRSRQTEFQQSLQTASSMPSHQNIKKLIQPDSKSGKHFVWKGRLIPVNQL